MATQSGSQNLPWWDQLQADAERQSDRTDISEGRLLSIAATAALDRVARTGLGAMVCSALAYR